MKKRRSSLRNTLVQASFERKNNLNKSSVIESVKDKIKFNRKYRKRADRKEFKKYIGE